MTTTARPKNVVGERHSSTEKVKLLIDGNFVDSKAENWLENRNPATQEILSQVPLCTSDEVNHAVEAAQKAYPQWRETPPSQRVRIMLRYQALIRENMDEIATCICLEQGKTFADALFACWIGPEPGPGEGFKEDLLGIE